VLLFLSLVPLFNGPQHTNMNKLKKTHLLKSAHKINPVVYIAQKGITETVQSEVEAALKAHALIKVKFAGYDKTEKLKLSTILCENSKAELVQLIGHVATLYRQKPKATKAKPSTNPKKKRQEPSKPKNMKRGSFSWKTNTRTASQKD